jgi:hypothetical protein
MLDVVQQPVTKHVQLHQGSKEPMQDIFSVSASDRTNESTDPSGTLVGLVYMLHEQVRPS